MEITKARDPAFIEECSIVGLHPIEYFSPPDRFVDPDTEMRLIEALRDGAHTATENILEALANAVFAHLDEDPELAFALADLTVSGRNAFRLFSATRPTDAALSATVAERVGGTIAAARLSNAVARVLDRAYQALWTIRHRSGPRSLGWIAVCAEIDQPYRPVNVPGTRHTQYDIEVAIRRNGDAPAKTISSRFAIFDERNLPEAADIDTAVRDRQLPPLPVPVVSGSSRYLCYIHGHSSRLEEGEKLGESLAGSGPFTLISMDLPCNGYASMFDHIEIAQETETDTVNSFPLLDLIEQYVIDFILAVGALAGRPIENQMVAVVGGSLGGNTSLRLARRDMDDHPWLNNFIAWSAASVWKPYTDIIRETGPNTARGRMQERDVPERRGEFVRQVFDDSVRIFGVKPQGEYWYRDDGWEPCKTLYLRGAREDRREIYNENFRRWHWRVALEQMLFSHCVPTNRLEKLQGRLLFLASEGDDYPWTHIHDASRDMAMLAVTTPGTLRLLKKTGHSIHDERPRHLAHEINAFLPDARPVAFSDERWTGWESLGGTALSEAVVAPGEDGRLHVFILDADRKVSVNRQLSVSGAWAGTWTQIRGGIADGDSFGASIGVERNWDGRLEVFGQYSNEGWATHVWQDNANGGWHSWDKGNHINQLIGGATDSVFAVERFGEAAGEISADGLRFDVGRRWLLVGAVRSNGHVHVRGQNDSGWWMDGKDLGEGGVTIVGTPFATRLVSGLLIILARDTAGRLLCIRENTPDEWQSSWQELAITVSSDASAALDTKGRLQVAFRDDSGNLALIREITPGGAWGTAETTEAVIAEGSKPAIVRNAWGELQVFVRWDDGSIRTRNQRLGPVREWTEWNNLGGTATLGPAVEASANGMLSVFCIGADQAVYINSVTTGMVREITAVMRDSDGITHLCSEGAAWSPIPVSEVIAEISGNDRIYVLRTPAGLTNRIIVRQILTTRPDASRENNLGSLPVIVDPRFIDNGILPAGSPASIRVTHTIRGSGNPFASIRGLHSDEVPLSVGRLTAIRQIINDTQQYHIENAAGERTDIIARVFLATAADLSADNNLDDLPEC